MLSRCFKQPLQCSAPSITKPTPDIDLLVQDLQAKILIICELKWSRKPNGHRERQQRDAEVLKGFSQIEAIRRFIESHPRYLYERGYIAWELSKFERIHYCVVPPCQDE